MNLREILSAVLGEAGFLVPDSFVGSTNPDDVQMVYLANRAARSINEGGYQKLRKRASVLLTSATEYDLPEDFLEMVPDTSRVNGRIDTLILPTDAPTWNYLQASTGPSGYLVQARLLDDKLNIYQPSAGDTVSYEYISNCPITDSAGTTFQKRFQTDTDLWLLDEDLIVLETKWRWAKEKGLPDWQMDEADARAYRISVRGRDSSGQTLRPITPDQVPPAPFTPLWVA